MNSLDSFPPPNSEVRAGTHPAGSSLPWLMAVLLMLAAFWGLPYLMQRWEYARAYGRMQAEVDLARTALGEGNMNELSKLSGLVAKRVGPSVVHIDTVRVVNGGRPMDEWSHLFGSPQRFQAQGQGSGAIVDPAGFIVTNNHVIEGAESIEVRLSDGRNVPGRVIGADPLTDVALIKIDADNLIAAEWGDSDALDVGALVWAIGNPFGLDRSVTFGIISAKGRPGNTAYQDFLQSDAAVNPGNSGGPLVDVQGKIIGINTAIVGQSYQGISFSIPSNKAREVVERLRETGKVARGWLGVALAELTPDLARKLGAAEVRGALVQDLVPGAPGAKAGLQVADIVIEWNGQPIDAPVTLSRLVAATPVGSNAKCVVLRDGERRELEVLVEERPSRLNR